MVLQAGPDATTLLSTALEKLLYLESRLESSEAGREQTAREVERLRAAATETRRALSEWRRRASHAEIAAEGAERELIRLRAALEKAREERPPAPSDSELARELEDARARLERMERERELWLDRMVALGRLRHDDDDELDLGSFIAELRAELMALRRGETDRPRATISERPPPPDAKTLLEGIDAPRVDVEALVRSARLSRPERTLALLCARELESDVPSVRRRAAERLAEARVSVLNPFVVERLHKEPDAGVRAALAALLETTSPEHLVLGELLGDPDPRVRAVALEGLARRGKLDFLEALADDVPALRRRVLTLLPKAPNPLEVLERALRDDDASVRRLAALALSKRSGTEAVALLQSLAASADEQLAAIAATALESRGLAGEEPSPEPESEPVETPELDEKVLDEVRINLRGRTPEDLVELLGVSREEVLASCERLVADGRAIWRGPRLYLP